MCSDVLPSFVFCDIENLCNRDQSIYSCSDDISSVVPEEIVPDIPEVTLENVGHDIDNDDQLVPTYVCDASEESEDKNLFISTDGIRSPAKSPKTKAGLGQRKKRSLDKMVQILTDKVEKTMLLDMANSIQSEKTSENDYETNVMMPF